jgi:hypothetical protein
MGFLGKRKKQTQEQFTQAVSGTETATADAPEAQPAAGRNANLKAADDFLNTLADNFEAALQAKIDNHETVTVRARSLGGDDDVVLFQTPAFDRLDRAAVVATSGYKRITDICRSSGVNKHVSFGTQLLQSGSLSTRGRQTGLFVFVDKENTIGETKAEVKARLKEEAAEKEAAKAQENKSGGLLSKVPGFG